MLVGSQTEGRVANDGQAVLVSGTVMNFGTYIHGGQLPLLDFGANKLCIPGGRCFVINSVFYWLPATKFLQRNCQAHNCTAELVFDISGGISIDHIGPSFLVGNSSASKCPNTSSFDTDIHWYKQVYVTLSYTDFFPYTKKTLGSYKKKTVPLVNDCSAIILSND
ncbi:hypothetical protein DSO57_1012154 [Entomophthora muscae]|uniref:Uncharacterized protein n=1 Tax=Entomophthora muscae TaxID=34485 RepID=A0ACC2U3V1_9FUNG|nr:hypothetical protein DSO57_1012154 [Entomophthora muscae]